MKRAIKQEELRDEEPEIDSVEVAKYAVRQMAISFESAQWTEEDLDAAIDILIKAVDEQAIHQIREEVSVYYPEQLFSPIPYMSYRCGNLWYKTVVLPGETREQAYDRAFSYLRDMVKKQFEECRREFWERHNSMSLS